MNEWTLLTCLAKGEPSAQRGDLTRNKKYCNAKVKNNSNKNKDILIGHSCNGAFQGLMKQNDETNNADKYNIVKNPNWQEPDPLAISKHEVSVNQETTPA